MNPNIKIGGITILMESPHYENDITHVIPYGKKSIFWDDISNVSGWTLTEYGGPLINGVYYASFEIESGFLCDYVESLIDDCRRIFIKYLVPAQIR